jgi:hypothetical protein
MAKCLYIFLDEGGNFDFSKKGTCYYTFTSVSMLRDFPAYNDLDFYKYDLLENGYDIEFFHCTENNSYIKARVFEIIKNNLSNIRIDNIVVRKCKTGTSLQEPSKFYAKMLAYLIPYPIAGYDLKQIDEVIVITDSLPKRAQRDAWNKAIKTYLANKLPTGVKYKLMHHQSRSHYGLQIADYCNWAIFKKWEFGNTFHYNNIKPGIKSEFDIFRNGVRKYYDDEKPL